MDILPTGGRNDGSGTAGDGDLHIPPSEHGRKVHCDQAHYGPVSGSRAETGAKDIQAVMGIGWGGRERDADGGSGGGTDGGRGGYGRDVERERLNWWEDNVEIITLGTDHNASISYAPGLEHHHLIMSTIGDTRVQLYIYIYIYIYNISMRLCIQILDSINHCTSIIIS